MLESEPSPDVAPVTGVATGSLGTGTALDDTQVFSIADLVDQERVDAAPASPERVTEEPPARPIRKRASKGPANVRGSRAPAAPIAVPPPVDAAPVVRSAAPRLQPDGRLAGLAAVVVVAVIAAAAILGTHDGATSGGNGLGAGDGLQTFGLEPTIAPSAPPAAHPAAHGRGNGNGNGKGHH